MIPLPSQIKLVEEKDKNTAVFEIEGLYPGYGVTIGNSLRRVLYSSLEGAAVTKVKVKGVQHEFSTIPGIQEDAIELCLNLKKLRFKVFSLEPQKVSLKVKGEKEIKGADFTLPSQVELVNKDVHIATSTLKSITFEMEIEIAKGTGYVPSELRDKEKLGVGEMSLDAIFAPVRRVAFHVKDMRVGDRTDYNKLRIEIETDGTITPKEALAQACDILISHFSLIRGEFEEKKKEVKKEKKKEVSLSENKIEDLKLSTRTINALEKNSIKTIAGLLKKKGDNFSSIEGLGDKGVEEIKKALKKLKIDL